MKKSKYIILLLVIVFILSGCNSNETKSTNNNQSNSESINTDNNEINTLHCTREATAKDGIEASFSYEIQYKEEYIQILHAIEKVTSDNSNSLDQYETAYKTIQKKYDGLQYYDNTIVRDNNSVTNDTTINYEKIDTDKLLEIEGSEDNVIKDGKVKLETWITFAEKLGVTCNNE